MVIDFNASNNANGSSRSAQSGAAAGKRDAGLEGASKDQASKAPANPPAADTAVKLSSQAQQLQAIEERLRDLPEVDSERVAQIRQAIAQGNYSVDSTRIADKLLNLEN